MIRENERVSKSMFRIYIMVLTIITFFAAIKLAQLFVDSSIEYSSDYLALLLLLLPLWFIGLNKTALLLIYRVNHYPQLFTQSIKFIIIATGILFGFVNLLNLSSIPKEVIFIFGILNHVSICISYVFANKYYLHRRKNGLNLKNIIIIADEESEDFIENLANHREYGYNISVIISDSQKIFEKFASRIKVVKKTMSLSCLIKSQIVDEVLYCRNHFNSRELQIIMNACKEVGVVFRLNSQLINSSAPTEIHQFESIPFITYQNKPTNEFELGWKYIFDFSFSFLIIILWMPIFILIGILIKLSSKGPIIFKQKRVGLHGREFYIYKFRTMMVDAEKMQAAIMHQNEANGPVFKIKNDPRINKIGKFLRKTSLDELPQFFNVLKGDMSLVGPRPPIMKEVNQYKTWQLRRLSMRPGITCTWQIMPHRNSISFEDWMKLDLQYIDNWSLQQDFLLTFKTLRVVFMGSGQ